jgi:macrolide-specific efflux system membrane fusion protein
VISTFVRAHRGWLAAGALVVAGVAIAAWFWKSNGERAPEYRAVKAKRGDIEMTVLSTGIVQPRNRLEIKPPIPGRVEQVLVEEGQQVRRGTILAWMSSTERAALLDAARAKGADEVKHWEELYRATPILAPIDGTLILRNVEPGQSFTSTDAVFVMSDRLIVVAQVDETDIGLVQLRQAARIELDAYPGQGFDGRVDQIAYDAKTVNNVTTYSVDVLPHKVPPFMRSGMTANVTFRLASRENVVVVPSEAVRTVDGRSVVLVPGATGAAPLEREVKTGLTDGKRVEIVAGIDDGETLFAARLKTPRRDAAKSSPLTPFRRR